MNEAVYSLDDIIRMIRPFVEKYHISEVYLFGSYARGEADSESDIDFLVYGGEHFKLTHIFAFAEELRKVFHKDIDAFEIHEVNIGSNFYNTIMREKVRVA